MINVFNQYTQRAGRIFKGSRDVAKMIRSTLATATLTIESTNTTLLTPLQRSESVAFGFLWVLFDYFAVFRVDLEEPGSISNKNSSAKIKYKMHSPKYFQRILMLSYLCPPFCV